MSHNQITVGGKTPNASGEIAVELNDLSDVSSSPSAGNILEYNGSAWTPAAASVSTELPYSMHQAIEWVWNSGTGFTYELGDRNIWRKWENEGYVDLIGGPGGSSFWVDATNEHAPLGSGSYYNMAFNIPAGDWLIQGVPNVRYGSSSSFIEFAWVDGSGNQYGHKVKLMPERTASVVCWGIVSLSSTTEIFLECTALSGTVPMGGGAEQSSVSFKFIKLG